MKISDLPRPWLLAAMTGVPMSTLLEQAERERVEEARRAWQSALRDEGRRCVIRRSGKRLEVVRLAS